MKNIYLYGASDDCHEVETDFGQRFESYGDIGINEVVAHYEFDDDWGIELQGAIPPTWVVKAINGNAAKGFRYRKDAGVFIHIQVPEAETITFRDLTEDDES